MDHSAPLVQRPDPSGLRRCVQLREGRRGRRRRRQHLPEQERGQLRRGVQAADEDLVGQRRYGMNSHSKAVQVQKSSNLFCDSTLGCVDRPFLPAAKALMDNQW